MGERTTYAPGSFCWVDVGTSDLESAKRFYAGLLGWEVQDGDEYPMFHRGGRYVAAAQPAAEGEPPNWRSYLSVVAVAPKKRARCVGGALAHR
jgi:predicted enzyme related to lactoylglutathione lyase